MKDPRPLTDLTDLVKSAVRPYLICSSWTVILIMWLNEIEIPPILLGVASAIAGEYILERVVKRVREK